MLHAILAPLLRHGALDCETLCAMACVCRDVTIDWDEQKLLADATPKPQPVVLHHVRTASAPCRRCGGTTPWADPFEPRHNTCPRCRSYIGTSRACQVYRLKHHDLQHLPRVMTYVRAARAHFALLRKRDVLQVAMLKHVGPRGLRTAMLPREQTSKARAARLQKLTGMCVSEHERAALGQHGLDGYVRSGVPGVRHVRAVLARFRELDGMDARVRAVVLQHFGDFVSGQRTAADIVRAQAAADAASDRMRDMATRAGLPASDVGALAARARQLPAGEFQGVIRQALARDARRKALADALGHLQRLQDEHLDVMSRDYVESGVGAPHDIERAARNYAWLHANTKYDALFLRMMDAAWSDVELRAFIEHQPQPQPDRARVWRAAQIAAVRNYLADGNDLDAVPLELQLLLLEA